MTFYHLSIKYHANAFTFVIRIHRASCIVLYSEATLNGEKKIDESANEQKKNEQKMKKKKEEKKSVRKRTDF